MHPCVLFSFGNGDLCVTVQGTLERSVLAPKCEVVHLTHALADNWHMLQDVRRRLPFVTASSYSLRLHFENAESAVSCIPKVINKLSHDYCPTFLHIWKERGRAHNLSKFHSCCQTTCHACYLLPVSRWTWILVYRQVLSYYVAWKPVIIVPATCKCKGIKVSVLSIGFTSSAG
jgi:hypothetical protein